MEQPKTDTRSQPEKFLDVAREVGACEDADDFKRPLRAIAKARGAKAKKAAKKPKR
jgi:hypothetical protein